MLSGLREHETAWVNIDEPRLGASLHGTDHVTAPIAYIRHHGRNHEQWFKSKNRDERYDYLYTPQELKPIAASVRKMEQKVEKEPSRREAKKIIATTNNHYNGKPPSAIDLKRVLGVRNPPVPDSLVAAYLELKSPTQRAAFGRLWLSRRHPRV